MGAVVPIGDVFSVRSFSVDLMRLKLCGLRSPFFVLWMTNSRRR